MPMQPSPIAETSRPARRRACMVSALRLPEPRRPLLEESLASLLRLFRPVVELERAEAELGDAAELLRVGIERLLREPECRRALLEELAAPAFRLGTKLRGRDDGVDEAHRERLLRRVLPAEVPDLPRLLLADDARQVRGAEPRIDAAHAWPDLSEDRRVGGNRQVAQHVEHVTAADREAVDHRDHGLWNRADHSVKPVDVHAEAAGAAVAARAALALVAAGGEGLVARAATHADDRGVLLPRQFGDAAGEYRALREGAALVDLGFRTVLHARGADRVTFLQGMLSNDVAALRPGDGCPALLLTIQGRVVADARVAATDDALLLDVDVRAREAFVEALERLIVADDGELGTPETRVALVGVEGPDAERLVGRPLAPYAHAETDVTGIAVRAARASEG